jgi:DNA-binding FadR family transcriptional regulator
MASITEQDLIVRRKLSDEVLDRLLSRIQTGEWRPGDQLPSERELMAAMGVGRPAIREALQSLQSMGMIAISHGERARVIAPSAEDVFDQIGHTVLHLLTTQPEALDHLKQARLMFECGMVRLATGNATAADIQELEAIHADMVANVQRDQEFVDGDLHFHETVAAVSKNPIYAAVSQALLGWLARFRTDMVRVPGREKTTIKEHRRILDAIRKGDSEEAAAAMADHINRASHIYSAKKSKSAGDAK